MAIPRVWSLFLKRWRGDSAVLGEVEKAAQAVPRPVVQMDMGDAAGLLGFEKFQEDIDGTNHAATLAGCRPACNRRIGGVNFSMTRKKLH